MQTGLASQTGQKPLLSRLTNLKHLRVWMPTGEGEVCERSCHPYIMPHEACLGLHRSNDYSNLVFLSVPP